MTKKEKEAVLHCLRAMIGEELCEECPLYGTTGTDHCEKDCVRLAIEELEKEPCSNCCNGNQIEKAKLCQKSYLAGMEHKQEPCNPQKPQSECEHDHEILKAHSDGANEVLAIIRAEIDEQYDRVHPYDISCAEGLEMALNIVDKYKAEGSGKE